MPHMPTSRRSTILLAAAALCGAVSAPAADTAGAKLLPAGALGHEVLAVNPFAFEGLEASDGEALRADGVERFCDRTDGLPCLLEAPVELPSGTVVRRLELEALDTGPADLKANFYRCAAGTSACDLIAEVQTAGAPGATQVGVDLAAAESIANGSFAYLLEVSPGNDALTRLRGARLVLSGAEGAHPADVLAMTAYAFEGRTAADRTALRAEGIQRYCAGVACTLAAPVELPSGAVVTRIELDAVDNGAADVQAGFFRCGAASGSCSSLGSVSTSGASGSSRPGLDLGQPETVDTSESNYHARVTLGATAETRLVGLRLFVDMPAALPRDDRLAVGPYSFEGRAATDLAALDAHDDERFCNGRDCLMAAPVDLPSGTAVNRIELAAYDASSADVRATFLRCAKGSGSCVESATVETAGTPGPTVVGADLGSAEIIDNSGFSYLVEVASGPNADTALRGVSLAIERALIFSDGFGNGTTSAWSSITP